MSLFTRPAVRLVTGSGDLGGDLHLVSRLLAGRPVGPESDHTSCETREVTHLVLQQPALPLGDVGQAAARLPHQVGLYRLRQTGREDVLELILQRAPERQ